MSAQPVEPLRSRVQPLDPNSPAGREASARSADISAAVINRLRREGRPVPGEPTDPSP